MDLITTFRKELPKIYRIANGGGKRSFCDYDVVFDFHDNREYLSFKKYGCRNHIGEFGPSKCHYNRLMALALILNGYAYKVRITREGTNLSINAEYTKLYFDMHKTCMYLKKKYSSCAYK